MEPEIFISYCRKDISKAKRIKEEIEKYTSAKCWVDLDGIESGSQFEDIIISAIDKTQIVLFLLSDNSMHSKWTKDEIRYAYETKKRIVPLNIDHCTPSGWFLFKFSGYDVIDYSDTFQKNKLFENLSEWIKGEKVKEIPIVQKEKSTNLFFKILLTSHYVVFGLILLVMSSLFFFGLLSMMEGFTSLRYNFLLCICLCITLFSTHFLFAKKEKKALYLIFILDVVEILLFCAVSRQIAVYALQHGYHYRSFPYVQLNGLGMTIIKNGKFLVTSLMESFTIIHMLLLAGVLMVRNKGTRLWDSLK